MAPPTGQGERRLVLAGLGHVHMRLLARLSELSARCVVTVVAPHDGRYGGALASMLAGQLDPARLHRAPPTDVEILNGRMVGAQPVHRRLWLADGRVVRYHLLSLNTGTRRLPVFAAPGADQPRVWSGHSMTDLIGLRRRLADWHAASIVIAGGSARALEIAGGLSASGGDKPDIRVTLLQPEIGRRGRDRRAYCRLARRGVDIVPGVQAQALGSGCVHTADGRRFPADHLIWAGPPAPSSLAHALGLPVAGPGLLVDRRLQSPKAQTVFAAGALASLDGRQTLAGWDAERQADVMIANIHGVYDSRSLRRYRPPGAGSWPLDLANEQIVTATRCGGGLARRRLRAERRRWLDTEA